MTNYGIKEEREKNEFQGTVKSHTCIYSNNTESKKIKSGKGNNQNCFIKMLRVVYNQNLENLKFESNRLEGNTQNI